MRTPRGNARFAGGFTLLEVLAAVAIFGIWYVALAGASLQGLRGEGESDRRLAASMIADQAMADLEAPMEAGVAPPVGNQEYEQEGFTVRVVVEPFDPLPLIPPPPQAQGHRPATPAGGSPPAASLLSAAAPGGSGPLRQVQVQVAWVEGAGERSVWRTTYALDLQGAQALLQSLAPAQGGAAGLPTSPAPSEDAP